MLAATAVKGLTELPPCAFVRSRWKLSCLLCWRKSAVCESLAIDDPSLLAQIQPVLDDLRSMVPPLQEAQFEP